MQYSMIPHFCMGVPANEFADVTCKGFLEDDWFKQEWTAIQDLPRSVFFGFPLSRLFVSRFPGYLCPSFPVFQLQQDKK